MYQTVCFYSVKVEVGNSVVGTRRVNFKWSMFFWLIKVKSNESNVEQVQRDYSNYWMNGGFAYGEKDFVLHG